LQGALAFSDASIEERGETPYIWLARGDVLLSRKEPRADYCFEKANAMAPRNWLVAWLAARIRYFHRQFGLAMKAIQQAIEWNAAHFILWLELGHCQRELGLIGLARNSYQQALQFNAECSAARGSLDELLRAGVGDRISGWWRRMFHS
jgi:tetratricopeptide (TPR) repeat protein